MSNIHYNITVEAIILCERDLCTFFLEPFFFFLFRQIRKRDASKFHAQLCIAMFFMLLTFLVGIDRTEHEVGCTISSLLIQYFSMASVVWTVAEALLMFQKLIIVFGRITAKHITILSVIAWCKYLKTDV